MQVAHHWLARLMGQLALRVSPYGSLVLDSPPELREELLMDAVPVTPSYVKSGERQLRCSWLCWWCYLCGVAIRAVCAVCAGRCVTGGAHGLNGGAGVPAVTRTHPAVTTRAVGEALKAASVAASEVYAQLPGDTEPGLLGPAVIRQAQPVGPSLEELAALADAATCNAIEVSACAGGVVGAEPCSSAQCIVRTICMCRSGKLACLKGACVSCYLLVLSC